MEKMNISKWLQTALLMDTLFLMLLWRLLGNNYSVDWLYVMIVVSLGLTVIAWKTASIQMKWLKEICHLIIYLFLAWAFLVIGGQLTSELVDLVIYILILVLIWFGIGFTAYKIKRLLKL